eukprot:463931-Alexandrium_andersonii.AAC.1
MCHYRLQRPGLCPGRRHPPRCQARRHLCGLQGPRTRGEGSQARAPWLVLVVSAEGGAGRRARPLPGPRCPPQPKTQMGAAKAGRKPSSLGGT